MSNANIYIKQMSEKDGVLTFSISGVNVCFVNALRRAIMANLPVVVFKTAPYEENKCTILKNTISGINNEYIKHRLSGIPIHITDIEHTPLQNYILEVNVENHTDTVMYVTTRDFKIKNVITDKYLSEIDTRNIFPPNSITGDFILFLKLRPQLAETIPGEAIHLTCEFSREMSGTDGMYVQACTCAYGNTPDLQRGDAELAKQVQKWRDDGSATNKEQMDLLTANWRLLDGRRIYVQNSFDFILESIGVYTNRELCLMACDYLSSKLAEVGKNIESGDMRIEPTKTTIPHSFDIFLDHDEDYTIGCILEHLLYASYVESQHVADFVGLKKFHPHDKFIVLRVGYAEPQEPTTALQHLAECAIRGAAIVEQIRGQLRGGRSAAVPQQDEEGPIKLKNDIAEAPQPAKKPRAEKRKAIQIPV